MFLSQFIWGYLRRLRILGRSFFNMKFVLKFSFQKYKEFKRHFFITRVNRSEFGKCFVTGLFFAIPVITKAHNNSDVRKGRPDSDNLLNFPRRLFSDGPSKNSWRQGISTSLHNQTLTAIILRPHMFVCW